MIGIFFLRFCRQKQDRYYAQSGEHVCVCSRREHPVTAWHACDCGIIW